jgi:hypothetical protein
LILQASCDCVENVKLNKFGEEKWMQITAKYITPVSRGRSRRVDPTYCNKSERKIFLNSSEARGNILSFYVIFYSKINFL